MLAVGIHNPDRAQSQLFESGGVEIGSLQFLKGAERATVYFPHRSRACATDMEAVFTIHHKAHPDSRSRIALLDLALTASDDCNRDTLNALRLAIEARLDSCCTDCGNHADLAEFGASGKAWLCLECFATACRREEEARQQAAVDRADHLSQIKKEDA